MNGLLELIEDHGEALEADLLAAGWRLRDIPSDRFDWHDLLVFVRHISVNSRLFTKIRPKEAGWDLPTLLLAEAVDQLRWLHWAKTEAAANGGDPPAPIPRPGVAPQEKRPGSGKIKGMPMEKAKQVFDRPDPNRKAKLYNLFRGG